MTAKHFLIAGGLGGVEALTIFTETGDGGANARAVRGVRNPTDCRRPRS